MSSLEIICLAKSLTKEERAFLLAMALKHGKKFEDDPRQRAEVRSLRERGLLKLEKLDTESDCVIVVTALGHGVATYLKVGGIRWAFLYEPIAIFSLLSLILGIVGLYIRVSRLPPIPTQDKVPQVPMMDKDK